MKGYADNPGKLLERYYQGVYDSSMKSLSVCNPRIAVEAVGFREWEGQWIGIMVTPWFMNLMVLPMSGAQWPDLKEGKGHALYLEFPYGTLKFEPRLDPDLGTHLACSLASPMDDFSDQSHATTIADEILASLNRIPMTEVAADAPDRPDRRALFTRPLALEDDQPQVAALLKPERSQA